jgi:hypothetical protein
MAKRGVIPAAVTAQLPPASQYANIQFASQAQLAAASKIVTAQWGPKVAGS